MTIINISNIAKKYFSVIVTINLVISLYIGLTQNAEVMYEYGKFCGTVTVYLFLATLIPGIVKRLKLANKIKNLYLLLNLLRRQIGILTFLFVSYHFLFIRGLDSFQSGQIYTPSVLSEWFGLIAFQLLFLLFITSNDLSVRKLGTWWKKLHSLTYIIIWFVMLHVAFTELSLAVIVFIFAIAEIYSLLYKLFQKRL
jgi:DMSO/TMAO reductase YedYZ heme-binding membrane subunit